MYMIKKRNIRLIILKLYLQISKASTLGNIQQDGCVPTLNATGIDTSKWSAVAFQHQVCYKLYLLEGNATFISK